MDYLQLFVDSYKRVMAREISQESFFQAFYRIFLSSSPEAAEKFRNTDMNRQQEMLRMSMDHMTYFSLDRQATENLRSIARVHGRTGADIPPELYDVWLEALVETVRLFDPDYDDEVDLAWRVALAPGITYMKQMYVR
jgi:hemoglobin-like flavoprotein